MDQYKQTLNMKLSSARTELSRLEKCRRQTFSHIRSSRQTFISTWKKHSDDLLFWFGNFGKMYFLNDNMVRVSSDSFFIILFFNYSVQTKTGERVRI